MSRHTILGIRSRRGLLALLVLAATGALGMTASIAEATPVGATVSTVEPVPTSIVAAAEATGQAGVLMKYSPASGTWSVAAVVDQPLSFALTTTPATAAEPEVSPKAAFACLVLTWSIGTCNDALVPYNNVIRGSDVVQVAQEVTDDELGERKISYDNWRTDTEILSGSNDQAGHSTSAGVGSSSNTTTGEAVTFDDFGDDFVYVIEDDIFGAFF